MTGRDVLIDYVRTNLIGPRNGDDETIDDPPSDIYTAGVLHPVSDDMNLLVDLEGGEDSGQGAQKELVDEAVRLTNEHVPSSVALSFFIKGSDPVVSVGAQAARYEKQGQNWQRKPCPDQRIELSPDQPNTKFWDGAAEIISRWRPTEQGHLVSVALVNRLDAAGNASRYRPEACLFQVGMDCHAENGEIGQYPRPENLAVSSEEAELLLRYSHVEIYAVGHGCAADWEKTDDQLKVSVSFIPFVEVPSLVASEGGNEEFLTLAKLRDADSDTLKNQLKGFVHGYEQWLEQIESSPITGGPAAGAARDRIVDRIRVALHRMRQGIKTLDDPEVIKSFQLAHRAMIMQMEHSRPSLGGEAKDLSEGPSMPDELHYRDSEATWRPFQLGFILTCLASLIEPEDDYRDTVDLIWAATGAGKTEAYLALAAIAIIHRRITKGSRSEGTAVITRYTLRLLTAQQFERTSRLACALEMIRSQNPELEGGRFTIGLWVGQGSTPNSFPEALGRFENIMASERPAAEQQGFQLEKCPWCGVRIIPTVKARKSHYGISATNDSFNIWCPNDSCDFHQGPGLPVQVVDAALYENPPTILIGTVDKFARLAWEEKPGVFFGSDDREPPALIIQDELHLLSGPLGTTVGLYEAAIETLCEFHGSAPKLLAATATIRDAGSQIQSLYGRNSALFPPAGIDERDSYFTQVDQERAGRGYLGVLSPNHTPSTSLVRTCAVLLQAPMEVELQPEERDAYWTLVAYHNSLRELGKSMTFARDDIPAWVHMVASNPDQESHRELHSDHLLELTGNVDSNQIPASLNRLQLSADNDRAVSFAACTNMLSVGVDVPRLGLMLVHGQPKTTAEYIQASSRVGRSETAGLVVTHYSSTKPRDRSHYEQFGSYHRSLYRWVEPTSVTPFSLQSRERALPAVLVTLVRHGIGLSANKDAHRFDPEDPEVKRCINLLYKRAKKSDPEEAETTRSHLERLVREWRKTIDVIEETQPTKRLSYFAWTPHPSLLGDFNSDWSTWSALHNMRNVDSSCAIRLITDYAK